MYGVASPWRGKCAVVSVVWPAPGEVSVEWPAPGEVSVER